MFRRAIVLATALLGLSVPANAQVPDTAGLEQLRQGLQSGQLTPEVLRARIQASGMSLDEVRQGLRALGYPENLLDQYLGQGAGAGAPALTTAQVEDVLRRLSIAPLDPFMVDSLYLLPDTLAVDSLLLDSLAMVEPIELPVFGRSLFERASTQFMPVKMGPVPANYRIGPGDELVLILTGDVQEVYSLAVTREGFVVIPNVGRVSVNGLTMEQLRNALFTYLGQVYSGGMRGSEATTFFEVSLASLRRNQVFVIGEVERPGAYEVSSVSTALDALYQAGGPAQNGSFRNIEIRRGEETVAELDLYEYLTQGAAVGDVPLDQGDVVFIPVRSRRVEIDGNVIRPGIYELREEEGLRALLDMAGGIEPEADLRRIQIDRVLPPDEREPGVARRVFDVNVASVLDEEGEFLRRRG
jgi:protein involved in polysaccharide export with SLBB domain